MIIEEFGMVSILENTQTTDLPDEGSGKLGSWHPYDGHQDQGNNERQGKSTAKKQRWRNAAQKRTLWQDAADVEEAVIFE